MGSVVLPVIARRSNDAGDGPAASLQVGSTMIRSPGAAASIALGSSGGGDVVGALPPMVTVTASMDCLPLPAVMTNWPHCAVRAAVLRLLLHGAVRHAAGHGDRDLRVAPA